MLVTAHYTAVTSKICYAFLLTSSSSSTYQLTELCVNIGINAQQTNNQPTRQRSDPLQASTNASM